MRAGQEETKETKETKEVEDVEDVKDVEDVEEVEEVEEVEIEYEMEQERDAQTQMHAHPSIHPSSGFPVVSTIPPRQLKCPECGTLYPSLLCLHLLLVSLGCGVHSHFCNFSPPALHARLAPYSNPVSLCKHVQADPISLVSS
ncbi:hypothetical protein TcWFU_004261 [Taenia crassiceps]